MNPYIEVSEANEHRTEIRVLEVCDISVSVDKTTWQVWIYKAQPGSLLLDWDSKQGARRHYSARLSFPNDQWYFSREAS